MARSLPQRGTFISASLLSASPSAILKTNFRPTSSNVPPRCFSDRRRAVAFSSCIGRFPFSGSRGSGTLPHSRYGSWTPYHRRSTTLCRYRLLPYLKTFIAQYPHISINISCQSTNHTLDMLRDGSIDLGLVAKPEDTEHISFVSQEESRMFSSVHPTISTIFRCVHKSPAWICSMPAH